jgi:hypothetical protein
VPIIPHLSKVVCLGWRICSRASLCGPYRVKFSAPSALLIL